MPLVLHFLSRIDKRLYMSDTTIMNIYDPSERNEISCNNYSVVFNINEYQLSRLHSWQVLKIRRHQH